MTRQPEMANCHQHGFFDARLYQCPDCKKTIICDDCQMPIASHALYGPGHGLCPVVVMDNARQLERRILRGDEQ